jgi:COP9 signalosome complex subunit 5
MHMITFDAKVTHARSGGIYEIMGLMQGKVVGDTLVIMDAFALPVQGTETRVNAANEANEFMVQFLDGGSKVRFALARNLVYNHDAHSGFEDWTTRARNRVVPLPSRLWMLAVWD